MADQPNTAAFDLPDLDLTNFPLFPSPLPSQPTLPREVRDLVSTIQHLSELQLRLYTHRAALSTCASALRAGDPHALVDLSPPLRAILSDSHLLADTVLHLHSSPQSGGVIEGGGWGVEGEGGGGEGEVCGGLRVGGRVGVRRALGVPEMGVAIVRLNALDLFVCDRFSRTGKNTEEGIWKLGHSDLHKAHWQSYCFLRTPMNSPGFWISRRLVLSTATPALNEHVFHPGDERNANPLRSIRADSNPFQSMNPSIANRMVFPGIRQWRWIIRRASQTRREAGPQ